MNELAKSACTGEGLFDLEPSDETHSDCAARRARLRKVCEAPIVFVTGYTDRDTVERIHEQVPGAPVLPKPVYHDRLANAVAAVSPHQH
jgi:hypothetical protein